jgi:hypothetical protein
MRIAVIGGILLLCAFTASAQGKVYKWVDTQGRVHYSANPPKNAPASEILIAPTPASAQQDARPAESAADADKDTAGEQAADAAARNDRMKQNCEIARQNLRVLEDPAIRRFREDGAKEAIYYTDEQRQARIAEAKKMVAAFCADGDKQ